MRIFFNAFNPFILCLFLNWVRFPELLVVAFCIWWSNEFFYVWFVFVVKCFAFFSSLFYFIIYANIPRTVCHIVPYTVLCIIYILEWAVSGGWDYFISKMLKVHRVLHISSVMCLQNIFSFFDFWFLMLTKKKGWLGKLSKKTGTNIRYTFT